MGNNKFLKARCKKTGRLYGLEIMQFSGKWKVINMTNLSESEAALVSSELKQPVFETHSNLLPCLKCGNRVVGGCNCSKRNHQCSKAMKYQFDCIYCNEFEIDYTRPTRSEVLGKIGETVTLSQGQEVKIQFSDDRPLSRIIVGVGWDPAEQGANIDIDSSVVVASDQEKSVDLVYYGAKEHPSGCVIHHGDNLTGIDTGNSDDENITVFLNKVPRNRNRIIFILNIYECAARHQTLGGIKNLYIKLYDPDSKKVLVEYKVMGNFSNDTSLIIGMAYKNGQNWYFKAIGRGSKETDVHSFANKCLLFCR